MVPPVPTLSDLLEASAAHLLVGRDAEMARFRSWLEASPPAKPILNVTGAGGVGKTTLLHAFRRFQIQAGRKVLGADGRDAAPSPGVLLDRLGALKASEVASALGEGGLLLLDSFEAMEVLTPFLQEELLPALPESARVVIAGRAGLGRNWDRWRELIVPMPLIGLEPSESREYVRRRGIVEPEVAISVVTAAGGHPLALALAADLAEQFGIRDFAAAGEWRLALGQMARELLRDVGDSALRSLLEAAAVVFHFDQSMLEAISGESNAGEAFARLCSLTIVRPMSRGLTLHDEIRRFLNADLRWRRPDRHRELRQRAFAHLTAQIPAANAAERARLHVERIALVDDDGVQRVYFAQNEPGLVWVGETRPSRSEVRRIAQAFRDRLPELSVGFPQEELDPKVLDALLDYDATLFPVARDRDGSGLGFGFCLPLSDESLDLLPRDGGIAALVAAWSADTGERLPATAGPDAPLYLTTIAAGNRKPKDAVSALARWVLPVVAATRRLLAATAQPLYQHQLGVMGFRPIDGYDHVLPDGRRLIGYVLDLSVIGGEAWVRELVAGRTIPQVPSGAALVAAIDGALGDWEDPERLAESLLVELARFRAAETGQQLGDDQLVRHLLEDSIAAAKQTDDREQLHAVRALELSTIEKSIAAAAAAERLNVSRATFYRLRKRGLELIAEAMTGRARTGAT